MHGDPGTPRGPVGGVSAEVVAAAAHAHARDAHTHAHARDVEEDPFAAYYARGFRSVYKPRRDGALRFAELLDAVADIDPEMRVRFTSPHPKDFPDEVRRSRVAGRPGVECTILGIGFQGLGCKSLRFTSRSRSAGLGLVVPAPVGS